MVEVLGTRVQLRLVTQMGRISDTRLPQTTFLTILIILTMHQNLRPDLRNRKNELGRKISRYPIENLLDRNQRDMSHQRKMSKCS